jgi:N-acyl homoserine lactone hydrolase
MMKPDDIRRLNLGYFTLPAASRWPGEKMVVCAYLVRSADGLLLFDTGIGTGHAQADREFGPIHRRSLEAELAGLSVHISDVTVVANCHLHLDHCGGNPLFPQTPIFVQRNELEALPTLDYALPEVVHFTGAALQVHDGEADIAPGLLIIPTPGHTPGHQSLIIETSRGRVLLAGQAVDFASDYGRAQFGLEVEATGSGTVIPAPPAWLAAVRDLDVQTVLFAHDRLAWHRAQSANQLSWT